MACTVRLVTGCPVESRTTPVITAVRGRRIAIVTTWPSSTATDVPGRPGTSVAVEEGQVVTIAMRLPRTAVITGVVLDSTGQPVTNLTVQAMRYGVVNGERRLVVTGTTRGPDERGAYRI